MKTIIKSWYQYIYFILKILQSQFMYQGTRKFVTNERSVPKQSRASYQQFSHTQKEFNNPYYAQYSSKKQLSKNISDADLRHPKQQYFKNLNNRRKNEGQMSNLKSELQNLKNEVNKLISKQSSLRTPQKQRPLMRQQKSDKKINYVGKSYQDEFTDRQEDFDDTTSLASVTTQKILNQPLRKLEKKVSSQNFDQTYYMQLQNDLLKTEIKNLKNKYVSKKRQLTEKCQLLQKKNEYLQISLQKSQQSLIECRKALQMQIMIIKKQITQKIEVKNANQPQTDKIEIQGNEMLKQKVKKLYEQLTQKSKQINNLNIQIGDLDAMLQRKKFQLKKQSERNLQLSKQIEFSKREQFRLQQYVQTQISKCKDLQKQNDSLKQRISQLRNELYTKQQIVSGSEQYQHRLSQELEEYKKREDELLQRISSLRQQNKKLKHITQSDQQEIEYLKNNNDDTIMRISQLSKKLKQQQEKGFEKEDYYRKIIEDNRRKQQEKIRILKQQYQQQTTHINQEIMKKQQNQNSQIHQILREKDRQINKWKAEYKILKLKHQQKNHVEKIKRQEIDEYYKGYVQYKNSVQLLQQKNKLLEQSIQKYLKILKDKQNQYLNLQIQHNQQVQDLKFHISRLQKNIQSTKDDLNYYKSQMAQTIYRADQQTKYRQQIQDKISHFIKVQLHGEQSEDESQGFQSIQNHQQPQQGNEKDKESTSIKNESPQKQRKQSHEQENQQAEQQRQFLDTQPQKKQEKVERKQKKSKTQQVKNVQISQSQKLQLQQLNEALITIKKRVIQQDQKASKNLRQLKNKDTQINKLKKQIRQLLQTHEKELSQMKEKYTNEKIQFNIKTTLIKQKEIKEYCEKQVEIYKSKYEQILGQNVQMKRKITELEKELVDLHQETKSLAHLYNVKCMEVQEIFEKHTQQNNQREKKIQELQIIKNHRETNLLNEINLLKDQINSLRLQIKNLSSMNKKMQTGSFDEALKNQIQSNKTIRQELAKKNEEIYKLRDNYTLLRSQYDNLRSESQIQKLRSISQRKNLEVQYQIEIQNLKNKLSVEQKKISSLQQKVSLIIQENKKKDSFIQSYIMGKKLPQGDKQFVSEFIKQYEIHLSGKQINQKLRADSHQLEKMAIYNYNLLKDMAEMKEKMLLYETMQGQNLSVYESFHSGEISRDQNFDSPQHQKISHQTPNKKFKKFNSLGGSHEDLNILQSSR